MSASKKDNKKTPAWELTGAWAGRWKMFAGIGVLGLVGAGAGFAIDPRRFAFSWLFAFVTVLALALGSLFFVLIQRLTSAGWSVTVRRTAEFFATGVLVLVPLFLPILISMGHLFPWAADHGGGHGGEHGAEHGGAEQHSAIPFVKPAFAQDHADAPAAHAPAGHADHAAAPADHAAAPADHAAAAGHGEHATAPAGHGEHVAAHPGATNPVAAGLPDPNALIHHGVLAKKSGYLNKNFFYVRAVLYFLLWGFLATRLFGLSAQQDKSKDFKLTLKAQGFAPGATFLYALSLTFAAFDWVMSLEPSWFSTIFGVYFFAAGVVSSLALLILVTLSLRDSGPLSGAVTVEHYHDLGKLMFGFTVFWAYIGFSQFMLIWYAALPEETTFYHNRWDFAPWATVSMILLFGHFVVPFFWTISRWFKRNTSRLRIGAIIVMVMHVVDMYWLVMPNYRLGVEGFTVSWIDLACLLAVGGIYAAFVFYRMTKFSLVPVGDPRLERALHFQNA